MKKVRSKKAEAAFTAKVNSCLLTPASRLSCHVLKKVDTIITINFFLFLLLFFFLKSTFQLWISFKFIDFTGITLPHVLVGECVNLKTNVGGCYYNMLFTVSPP